MLTTHLLAWASGLPLRWWRVPWCAPLPIRIPVQAPRYQGALLVQHPKASLCQLNPCRCSPPRADFNLTGRYVFQCRISIRDRCVNFYVARPSQAQSVDDDSLQWNPAWSVATMCVPSSFSPLHPPLFGSHSLCYHIA